MFKSLECLEQPCADIAKKSVGVGVDVGVVGGVAASAAVGVGMEVFLFLSWRGLSKAK